MAIVAVSSKKQPKQVIVKEVIQEIVVSKGVDKNRFAPLENKLEFLKSWGYCFCDNCNTEKNFKRTSTKVICHTCSYIIAYLDRPIVEVKESDRPNLISIGKVNVLMGLF